MSETPGERRELGGVDMDICEREAKLRLPPGRHHEIRNKMSCRVRNGGRAQNRGETFGGNRQNDVKTFCGNRQNECK